MLGFLTAKLHLKKGAHAWEVANDSGPAHFFPTALKTMDYSSHRVTFFLVFFSQLDIPMRSWRGFMNEGEECHAELSK